MTIKEKKQQEVLEFADKLSGMGACEEAVRWVRSQPSLAVVYRTASVGWAMFLLSRTKGKKAATIILKEAVLDYLSLKKISIRKNPSLRDMADAMRAADPDDNYSLVGDIEAFLGTDMNKWYSGSAQLIAENACMRDGSQKPDCIPKTVARKYLRMIKAVIPVEGLLKLKAKP
jgi:hypothetical protein